MEYKNFPNSVFVTRRHWLVSMFQYSSSADIIVSDGENLHYRYITE
jgi:hypothetical protein